MNIEAVLDGLLRFAEDDWIGLWVIASDVEEELGIDDPTKNLEITLVLVKELLKRGLRAGDSPVHNSAVHFNAWSNQDPDAVIDFIRREWAQRGGLPGWGDRPWFAAPPVRAELDRLKEEVAYLKLWQGIVVVTDISLAGWLIAADSAPPLRVYLALLGVILLSSGIVVLHRQINGRLEQIGKL